MLINTCNLSKHDPFLFSLLNTGFSLFYQDHLQGQGSKNNRRWHQSVFNKTHRSQWEEINLRGIFAVVGQQRRALSLTLKDALGFSASSVLSHMAQQTPLVLLASLPDLAHRVVKSSSLTNCRLHIKANRRISLCKQLDPIQIYILDSQRGPKSAAELMIGSIETS